MYCSPDCFRPACDPLLTQGSCKAYPPCPHAGSSDHHSSFCRRSAHLRCAVAALRGRRTRNGWRRFGSWRFVFAARRREHTVADDGVSRDCFFCHQPGADPACAWQPAAGIDSEPNISSGNANPGQTRNATDLAVTAVTDAAGDQPCGAAPRCSGCPCGAGTAERPTGALGTSLVRAI